MRKLYLQIYVSFVGILILFGLLAGIVFVALAPTWENVGFFEGIGALIGELLPGPDRPVEEVQAALEKYSRHLPADINLRGPDGAMLAKVGEVLPAPRPGRAQSGWLRAHGGGPFAAFRLPDGRWLVARYVRDREAHAVSVLTFIGILAFAIALGAYPLARRLTRRLERLQTRVDELGAGDLSARVEVEGTDEIAGLARSFNRAADRIEHLVQSQKSTLAEASHELRTPLARLSVAAELLAGDERPELRTRMEKDIGELDELIGELLLASRLDSVDSLETREEIDLLALLAEEAARTDAMVTGEPVTIDGDPRLLRRLIRNLLVNAERYAAGSAVEASVVPHGPSGAILRVTDGGPGVPEEERDRIFEPFYRPAGASGKGAGLGLALVRRIARHHGGEARCFPTETGTSFEVTLST
jgi:signal transduction histidine kinase